jgi:hypothetical protein
MQHLEQLIINAHIPVKFVWYDIGCKWQCSWRQYTQEQVGEVRALAEMVRCPLPPFHVNMHT